MFFFSMACVVEFDFLGPKILVYSPPFRVAQERKNKKTGPRCVKFYSMEKKMLYPKFGGGFDSGNL